MTVFQEAQSLFCSFNMVMLNNYSAAQCCRTPFVPISVQLNASSAALLHLPEALLWTVPTCSSTAGYFSFGEQWIKKQKNMKEESLWIVESLLAVAMVNTVELWKHYCCLCSSLFSLPWPLIQMTNRGIHWLCSCSLVTAAITHSHAHHIPAHFFFI